MILRRFMKHVTDQNWFAVGLDVIVVIVGIFLGLQVQDWNQNRTDRIEEESHLIALKEDITASIDVIEISISGKQEIKLALNRLSTLIAVDFEEIDTDQLEADISKGLFDMSQFTYQMNVYDHLKTSGQLSLIEDNDLKLLLTKIGSQIENHDRAQVGELNAQYATIDTYLIENYSMSHLLSHFQIMEDFETKSNESTPDYKSFILDAETQNLITYKFFFMSNNIRSLTEILKNYRIANTQIDQRLFELSASFQ